MNITAIVIAAVVVAAVGIVVGFGLGIFGEAFKVEVDENQETASKYEIMSVPTLMIFKDGEPVDKLTGFQPKTILKEWLDRYITPVEGE